MEEIRNFLEQQMKIDDITYGINGIIIKGVINPPVEQTIKQIKDFLSQTEYTPIFDKKDDYHIIRLGIFKPTTIKQRYWLNVLLFIATIFTTIFAGYLNSGSLSAGIAFSFSIMAILTCHELGHYFVSRQAGMITTLPYFIPVPFHFIGTFGAVIRMKSVVPSRSTLLRVGMAGPVAGFLVALPITIIGISLSTVKVVPETGGFLKLGNSLLFYILIKIMHSNIAPNADLYLHPMAFAGWLGFLVTSMNLIPVGQLDGGHVAYSIFLKKRKYIYPVIFGALIALSFLWLGWLIWALLAFIFARRDTVIQDCITPLTKTEKLSAILPLIILFLTFTPQPFSIS